LPDLNLSGRITSAVKARAISTSPRLAASRIILSSAGRAGTLYLPRPFSGRISSRTASRAYSFIMPALSGRITTRSTGRITLNVIPLNLSGRIKAISSSRVLSGAVAPILSGRIISASTGRIYVFGLDALLSGRISAISYASSVTPRITPALYLTGRISSRSAAKTSIGISGTIFVSGRIAARSAANIRANLPAILKGTTRTIVTLSGVAQPLFELIRGGTITTMVGAHLLRSELLEPLPPYPLPFPVQPVDYWLNLITSEHISKPRYFKTVGVTVDPVVAGTTLVASIPGLFDLDYSHGEQEDFTGQWIGKSRWMELPNSFFSWDYEGIGWNQANWRGPYDTENTLQRLDDYHYRLLLYATVIANQWDGSIPNAYEAWDTLFHYTGLKVIIQDYGNMTMLYGLLWESAPDQVLLSLFTTGQMDLRPEGIELISYIFQYAPNVPLFSYDAESTSVSGWDYGAWGTLVPPGLGFSPIMMVGE
jgi:hypothetical protein